MDEQDLIKAGRTLYRECHEEFYNWSESESSSILKSLRKSPPKLSRRLPIEVGDEVGDEVGEHEESSSSEDATCSIATYSGSGTRIQHAVPLTTASDDLPKVGGIPRYTQCSPLSRSMTRDLGAGALFVPFADSEEFPIAKYLREFPFLEWEKRFNDPEVECLEYEVAKKLSALGYTYDEIDKAKLFHRGDCTDDCAHDEEDPECNTAPLLLRKGNKSGLIWEFNQSIHTNSVVTPPFKIARPTLHNSSYTLQHLTDSHEGPKNGSDARCDRDCFRGHLSDGDNWMDKLPALHEDDKGTLQSVLKLDPDMEFSDLPDPMLVDDEDKVEETLQPQRRCKGRR
ncbi:Histone-lysine N-methyltransferase setd7 [Marasmius crinis-equi]|uniref:Histone-lysine N-methyltransferase setd7 n=1 Tax=Marasmius crinis-equi TaxID=585013 RepID=A0ABR3EZ27_9AGAR